MVAATLILTGLVLTRADGEDLTVRHERSVRPAGAVRQLRVRRGNVVAVPADDADFFLIGDDERPDTVPLELKLPVTALQIGRGAGRCCL